MMGLPAGILLLVSLGALLSGLLPSRAVKPDTEPIDPELFNKIQMQVSRPGPLTVQLSEFEMIKAGQMLRNGASMDEIARAVSPEYEAAGEHERRALQDLLARALKR